MGGVQEKPYLSVSLLVSVLLGWCSHVSYSHFPKLPFTLILPKDEVSARFCFLFFLNTAMFIVNVLLLHFLWPTGSPSSVWKFFPELSRSRPPCRRVNLWRSFLPSPRLPRSPSLRPRERKKFILLLARLPNFQV